MGRARQTVAFSLCAAWLGWAAAAASGSDWVTFADETLTRLNPLILVNDDVFGKSDTEEKDYVWGDVDQDGDIDLIVVRKLMGSNSGAKVNRLFMNEGTAEGHAFNGVLVDRTSQYATDATDGGQGLLDLTADRDVALLDVNDDGWLDIVTSTTYGAGLPKSISHPRIYLNKKNDAGG